MLFILMPKLNAVLKKICITWNEKQNLGLMKNVFYFCDLKIDIAY